RFPVDYTHVPLINKCKSRRFIQFGLAISYPLGLYNQFSFVFIGIYRYHFLMKYMAVPGFFVLGDGFGIVPVVDAVHIPVIEPHPDMMGMICSFTGHFL